MVFAWMVPPETVTVNVGELIVVETAAVPPTIAPDPDAVCALAVFVDVALTVNAPGRVRLTFCTVAVTVGLAVTVVW